MFRLLTLEDVIKVPPDMYGSPVQESVRRLLEDKYEGMVFEDLGFVVCVVDFTFDHMGKIAPGEGDSYHRVTFRVLTFLPEVQEVMLGKVVEIEEYGGFVRIGPFEALLHVSSILDDYVDFNKEQATLVGRKTGRVLSVGDWIRLRVTAVSIGGAGGGDRVGVTTRQPFMGKEEWIAQELKKLSAGAPAQ